MRKLRTSLKNFIGRNKEIEEILKALHEDTRAWIISLKGVGGIGKTELAIKVTHEALIRNYFKKAVWTSAKTSWLKPEGITIDKSGSTLSLNDLFNTIIETLEFPEKWRYESIERKKENIVKELKKEPILIIVDNLETIEDYSIIKFLIDNVPSPSKALVTTRLGGKPGDDLRISQRLEGQKEITVGPFTKDEAVRLFKILSREKNLPYYKKDYEDKIEQTVNEVGLIPLAIEWIIGKITLEGYKIDDALKEFSNIEGDVLKFCFENLYAQLSNNARDILRAIPIFALGTDENTLVEITRIKPKNFREAKMELISSSLIEMTDDLKYTVLPPTKIFVNILWKRNIELSEQYFENTVEFYVGFLQNNIKKENWRMIELEHDNIFNVFSWSYSNFKFVWTVNLAEYMIKYLNRIGYWDERALVCEFATIAANNEGDKEKAILFSYAAAQVYKQRGKLEEAKLTFLKNAEYSNATGNYKQEALAKMQLGVIYRLMGDKKTSDEELSFALSYFKKENIEGEARILTLLARNEIEDKNYKNAKQRLEESLELKIKIGNQLGIAINYYLLGRCHSDMNEFLIAEKYFQKSKDILENIGEKRHQSNLYHYYGKLKKYQQEYDLALNYLMRAREIEKQLHREKHYKKIIAEIDEIQSLSNNKLHYQTNFRFNCKCSNCSKSDNLYVFEIEQLLTRLKKGKFTAECPISFEDVSIDSIINDDSSTKAMTKQKLYKLIAKNEVDEVIKLLEQEFKINYNNAQDLRELYSISASYKEIRKREILGLSNSGETIIQLNKLRIALITIIEGIK